MFWGSQSLKFPKLKILPCVFYEGALYFLREAWLGRFILSWIVFYNFFIRDSWLKMVRSFHVHVNEFFQFNMTREWRFELNVIREPLCFAWWISAILLFWKYRYSFRTAEARFWQDMDFIWID